MLCPTCSTTLWVESDVLPVKLLLLMKNLKYAIRLLKIAENNSICQRIPKIYSIKFENIGFDTSLRNNKYVEWNEVEKQTINRHTCQLIPVLHSVSEIVHKTYKFGQSYNFIKPWKSVLLFLHHQSSPLYTIGPPLSTLSVLLFVHHRSSSFYTVVIRMALEGYVIAYGGCGIN